MRLQIHKEILVQILMDFETIQQIYGKNAFKNLSIWQTKIYHSNIGVAKNCQSCILQKNFWKVCSSFFEIHLLPGITFIVVGKKKIIFSVDANKKGNANVTAIHPWQQCHINNIYQLLK